MLKPHTPRLTHQSTISHMLEQHVTSILHHARALHAHVITKRAPTRRHTPVIPKPLGPNQATHQARRNARISRRTHNQRAIRHTHRPHTRPRIIPLDRPAITNRTGNSATRSSRRCGEPATLSGLTLSEESLTLRHRPEMRRQLTIRTHKPTRPRLRTTPHNPTSSLTPNANMKTSHQKTSRSPQHNTKRQARALTRIREQKQERNTHAKRPSPTKIATPRRATRTHPHAAGTHTKRNAGRTVPGKPQPTRPAQATNKPRRPRTTGRSRDTPHSAQRHLSRD